MSNRIFSDTVSLSDLPCMNCLRVEMGERACYTGSESIVVEKIGLGGLNDSTRCAIISTVFFLTTYPGHV